MNPLKEKLAESLVVFDGAIGTEIYRRNFFVNASYEQLNLTAPAVITEIHKSYLDAGAEVLTTNTFNANARRLAKFGLADQTAEINRAGVRLAALRSYYMAGAEDCPAGTLVLGYGALPEASCGPLAATLKKAWSAASASGPRV